MANVTDLSHKTVLLKNKRLLTGEQLYKCNKCDIDFANGTDIKRYMMIHSGVRPYSCSLCSSSFSQNITYLTI